MTWLRQMQPGEGAVLLRDYPGEVVRIDCRRCGRPGRYRLASLIERNEPAAELSEVLTALLADCARRQGWRIQGPYGSIFPDLRARLQRGC
jgi:hypothetical protein